MNAGRSLGKQRLLSLLVVSMVVAGAAGCSEATTSGRLARTGSKATPKSGGKGKPRVDAAAEFQRLMSRENGPFPKHRLQLFGGLATGEYEAVAASHPECTAADAEGDSSCDVPLSLGPDADGDASVIHCLVDTTPRGPFGAIVAHRLDGAGLMEMPKFSVAKTGEGVSVSFVANWMKNAQDTNTVGTLKVATFYSQGYSATCSDTQPGGRKTFERVVGDFFRSLKLAPNPSRPALMTMAYDLRQGDRSTGFRYGLVEKRIDGKAGTAEIDFAFRLKTDGKTWQGSDNSLLVARGVTGNVELYRHAFSGANGQKMMVLSAKPSEDGKFRLKLERGEKTDALEATPKAPLSTELWSAGEFAKVARGARTNYRYATLGIDDTGDPTFNYLSITRSSPGVLLEEEEAGKKNARDLDASLKDELHVLDDGSVAKEVSTDSISQRIHTWGKLPDASGVGGGAPEPRDKGVVKAVRAKVKGKAAR